MTLLQRSVVNLLGHLLPLFAAFVSVPLLVNSLEAEIFGFLSLAWVLVGYFSLFDFGLGRALTRIISERIASDQREGIPILSRIALLMLFLLGIATAIIVGVLAPWLVKVVLSIPVAIQSEATLALQVLAATLPLVTITSGFRGILEAEHRFGWVNALRAPIGAATFIAPAVLALHTSSLIYLCASLALVRALGAFLHWLVCRRLYPNLVGLDITGWSSLRLLLIDGAWMTISNVLGPMMVYLDRFVIASLASLTAVAYYTAPYEIVTRLWLIPAAISGVLFPAFASLHTKDLVEAKLLYRNSLFSLLGIMLPTTLLVGVTSEAWLEAWINKEYAIQGAVIAQVLCLGVLFNSMAYIPLSLLQASGRSDTAAKLHMIELPGYLALLYWLVNDYSAMGAAIAWTIRCVFDSLFLFVLAGRHLRCRKKL